MTNQKALPSVQDFLDVYNTWRRDEAEGRLTENEMRAGTRVISSRVQKLLDENAGDCTMFKYYRMSDRLDARHLNNDGSYKDGYNYDTWLGDHLTLALDFYGKIV